jgi:hypothetical protein
MHFINQQRFTTHTNTNKKLLIAKDLRPSYNIDTPPHSLKDPNASLKMEIMKKQKVRVCSLTYNILGAKGCVKILGWGLG